MSTCTPGHKLRMRMLAVLVWAVFHYIALPRCRISVELAPGKPTGEPAPKTAVDSQ